MRVFLAGTAAFKDRINLRDCDYLLESFYYFKDWQLPYIKGSKMFLLDSGAVTFMNGRKIDKDMLEKYTQKLGEFVKKNDVDNFFNVDVETIYGIDYSRKLRDLLEDTAGKKCIPVFHKMMGIEGYEELLRDYKYIAIGTIHQFDKHPEILKKLLSMANARGVKVHGLGFTRTDLESFKFYSVDSTSWTCGNRFGYLYRFNGNGLDKIGKPTGTRVKSSETLVNNFIEWCKYQKYMDTK